MHRVPARLRPAIVVFSFALGCASDDGGNGQTDGSSDTGLATTGDSSATQPGTTTTDGGPSTGDDVATASSGGVDSTGSGSTGAGSTGEIAACGRVDVLLVLDASGSMGAKVDKLTAALQDFAQALPIELGTNDIHWLVTDIDPWRYEACQDACTSAQDAGCLDGGTCDSSMGMCFTDCPILSICGTEASPPYTCGATAPAACEDVLGAGIVHPQGADSSGMDCGLGDARWLSSDDPEFTARFACLARVGSGSWSNTEAPVGAALMALSSRGDAAACNEGFRRDDAALVVVFATDEDDALANGTPGTPAAWADDLLALAGGQPLVVGGLFGDTGSPGSLCVPFDGGNLENEADAGVRLMQWIDALGAVADRDSICAVDFTPFFADVIDRAVTTCAAS